MLKQPDHFTIITSTFIWTWESKHATDELWANRVSFLPFCAIGAASGFSVSVDRQTDATFMHERNEMIYQNAHKHTNVKIIEQKQNPYMKWP